MHLDCAPPASCHTGAHHAVYSIGKIVCRVSETYGYNSADPVSSPSRSGRRPSGPGTTITDVESQSRLRPSGPAAVVEATAMQTRRRR